MHIKKIRLIKYIAVLLIVAILSPAIAVKAADGNWGLGYPELGKTPSGNESMEYLKKYNAYYVGNADEKTIYLTFDAGYENGNTEPILDALKKHDIPAAFFLVGTYIRDNPDLIKRMVGDGHIVANHTMHHPDMSDISEKGSFAKELTETEEIYQSVVGSEMPKYYRPPRGKYSEKNMEMANELGYKTIFWSLAYVDWDVKEQPTKEQAFSKLMPRIHPGAVILLHSTSKTNALIMDELIQQYKDLGYTFKSLDDLTK